VADRWKILGQLQVTVFVDLNTYYDLYEVPLPASKSIGDVEVSPKATSILTRTLVTSLVACNRSAAVQSLRSKLVAANGDETQLHGLSNVPVGGTDIFNLGFVLSPGDKIEVLSFSFGAVDLHLTMFGVETTSSSGPN